ncbi:RHS repeat-associated core domain-containing protein [Streptomyces cyaneofuscatus]|uniref:RHS repeat-associated core domain-containing protein n=1 Tax=Streptomyces cyaneofuscatus TaxID=66883 RepID=UPI003444D487
MPVLGALVLALAVPTALPPGAAAASVPGAPDSADSRVSRVRPVTGQGAQEARARVVREKKENERLIARAGAERAAAWPKAKTSRDSLTATTPGSLVDVSAVAPAKAGRGAPPAASGPATVAVQDQRAADRAGITGVLFTVGAERKGAAQVTVDYGSFASAVGGNWSGRLGLVRLPECALTTPENAECRTATPVESSNDVKAQKVTARTAVPAGAAPMVMALTATSGTTSAAGGGDLAATPLSASSSWEAGASSGSFAWSYPIALPPAAAGPVPPLSLSYDSGSVDGRTANTNNQGSLVGEGFSLTESYVERTYGSCEDDGQTDKSDQCWKYENASLVLNGSATELVKDDKNGRWRLKNDDASQVFHETGADNGDDGEDGKDGKGEYWRLVTGEGTTYTFGLNKLPGAGAQRTDSTWTVPVFGDDSGEPGFAAGSAFADRAKTQAWRWNLDLVEDVHGNASTYWYTAEANHYAKNGVKTKLASYVRGGYPTEIRYGQRADTLFTGNPSGKVTFSYKERCTAAKCDELKKDTADNWPDVPFDAICSATEKDCLATGPAFFTRKRVASVNTHVWSTAAEPDAFKAVDSYALSQGFFDGQEIDNSSDQTLTLTGLKRTGLNGTAISLPEVGFTYQQRPNRVAGGTQPGGGNILSLNRPRISTITSEAGAITTVVLSNPECVRGSAMPAAEDDNAMSCYPVHWPVNGGDPMLDWFHKYRVTSVNTSDPAAKNPAVETSYEYAKPGWHYNDDPFTKEKERTWSVWRGYQQVTTYTGEVGATRGKTVKVFMQGMNGDKLKTGSRTATVVAVPVPAATLSNATDHDYYAGQLRQEITYDGNTPISVTVNNLWAKETASQQKSYAHTKAHFVRPARTYTYTWLTAPKKWRIAATSQTYDGTYGMVTAVENHGDWGATGDETCSRTWYARNDAKGLTSLVSRTRTVGKPCADTDNKLTLPASNGTRGDVLSDSAIVYDDPAAKAWTAKQTPTLGLPTWTGQPTGYPSANGTADRDPGAGSWQTVAATAFDTDTAKLGRPLRVTDAKGNVTSTAYFPANTGPVTGVVVTHPKLNSNGQTHKSYTYFDPARGSVTYALDTNLKRTEHTRDALGRATATWLPNRSKAAGDSPNGVYTYGLSRTVPSWTAVASLKADGTTYRTSYTLYDSLLRQVQTQTPGATGGRVLTDTRYDARGLAVVTQSDAFDSAKAPNGTYMGIENAQAPVQNETVYDGAGRAVKTTLSSWGTKKWDTTTTYTGDSVAVSAVQGGTASRVITDALGRTAETRTYAGPQPHDTQYGASTGTPYTRVAQTYTLDAKPLTVTAPDDSTWSYTYDLYGRKLNSTDPDTGTTTTWYTVLDQVDTTKDAEGRILHYGYDELGRRTDLWHTSRTDANKLAKWTFDGVLKGFPDQSIRYENGVGQPTSKSYVKAVTAYDSQSRPTTTTLTLPATDPLVTSGAVTATTTFGTAYRLDGTVNNTKEPAVGGLSAETVETLYNDAGLPVQQSGISGYLLGVDYSAIGQVHQLELGTSAAAKRVFVSNTFEAGTGRLLTSATDDQTRGPVQDLHYGYDQAGNVTSLFDRASTGTGADHQCFTYDGQRRLDQAWTPKTADCAASGRTVAGLGGPAPYWNGYTYNASGQRATETRNGATPVTTSYCYDPARKHALKATTTSTAPGACTTAAAQYTYDDTGNAETRAERAGTAVPQSLAWNHEGKLAKLTEGGSATDYVYDADGTLLIRRDGAAAGESVLYLGNTEVHLKSGKKWANRYYTVGSSTIAVRSNQTGAEKVAFLSADHHGTSSVAITSDTTQTLSKRYTTPFGAARGTPAGLWPDDKGFLGKPVDSGTGLTHVGARQYDASTGQFISVDPVLSLDQHQSLNGYGYANNNPTTLSDPSGLAVPECREGLIACTGGVPDLKKERARQASKKEQSSRGTSYVNRDGRSGKAPAGAPRYNRALEEILFTNADIAAQLRAERVKQILDGEFDLTNYYKEAAEDVEEKTCHRGARDGCGAANLAKDIWEFFGPFKSDVEDIMERIDESWKRANNKAGASDFGFDDDAEFQVALTLAIHGHKVMSRNDDQVNPHRGDAWVDDMRADFKSPVSGTSANSMQGHLRKAEKQRVDLAVVDLRRSGMSEEAAMDGFRSFDKGGRHMQKVIVYGNDFMLELDVR